jgi:hypothetical protein
MLENAFSLLPGGLRICRSSGGIARRFFCLLTGERRIMSGLRRIIFGLLRHHMRFIEQGAVFGAKPLGASAQKQ